MHDEELLRLLRGVIHAPEPVHEGIAPLTNAHDAGSLEDRQLGRRLISEGRVGCLIVAGGQGTRLGFAGPKGLFPVTPIKHKTLFQLLAERALAAGEQAGRKLPLAIMTSATNDQIARQYFADQRFFGLDPHQVSFFMQAELPFLDPTGNPVFSQEGGMVTGPDGNGGALEAFCQAGLADVWSRQGVQFVNFIQIDNPLADPFDAELVGFHARMKGDATIKAVVRKSPSERTGTIVQTEEGTRVVEYSELPEEDRHGHRYANISCFCFSMDFVRRAKVTALHKAWKKMSGGKEAWKFERFIFDVLPQAQAIHVLVYDRAQCFAPLKNAAGDDSLATVVQALYEADKRAYELLSGLSAPHQPFELHPRFHYPTEDLIRKWKGKRADEGYLED